MVHITYSYTTATILESSGIYKYAHNEVKILSAVVKSMRDPTISRDVTQMMKHFISTQKMSDSVSMKSFTVDSSKLIDYTGCDIDPGHQKKMEIKLAYSDCVLFMNDINVPKNDKNVNNSIILEKTGNYYFSAVYLDVVKAVVRSVNNHYIVHDVTCALDKEVYMFQGMRYIKIDSSLFNIYTGCDIDPHSKKYLEIILSNHFHHPPKPCHPHPHDHHHSHFHPHPHDHHSHDHIHVHPDDHLIYSHGHIHPHPDDHLIYSHGHIHPHPDDHLIYSHGHIHPHLHGHHHSHPHGHHHSHDHIHVHPDDHLIYSHHHHDHHHHCYQSTILDGYSKLSTSLYYAITSPNGVDSSSTLGENPNQSFRCLTNSTWSKYNGTGYVNFVGSKFIPDSERSSDYTCIKNTIFKEQIILVLPVDKNKSQISTSGDSHKQINALAFYRDEPVAQGIDQTLSSDGKAFYLTSDGKMIVEVIFKTADQEFVDKVKAEDKDSKLVVGNKVRTINLYEKV